MANIINIFNSATYVFKIAGIYPPKAPKTQLWDLLNVAYSITFSLIFFGFSLYGVHKRNLKYSQNHLVLQVMDFLQIHIAIFTCVVIILNSVFLRKKLTFCFRKLEILDYNLIKEKKLLKKSYKNMSIKYTLALATIVLEISIYAPLDYIIYIEHLNWANFGDLLAYNFPPAMTALFLFEYYFVLLLIKQRFKWVNRNLLKLVEKFFQKSLASPFSIYGENFNRNPPKNNEVIRFLDNIRRQHDSLGIICREVNGIFAFPMILTTLTIFLTGISYIYSGSSTTHLNFSTTNIAMVAISLITTLSGFILVTRTASNISREAQNTGNILHLLQTTATIYDKIFHFSLQLKHSKVKFSAMKVFTIDEKLLLSMIGAISTYLVITIQFEISL